MRQPYDDIDELLGKYFSGEATEAERMEVEKWSSMTEQNKLYFDQTRIIFERAASVKNHQFFDVDRAWDKMKHKMGEQSAPAIEMRSSSAKVYWRIAASVLLLMAVGYIIYSQYNKPEEKSTIVAEQSVVQDTLPDGSTAVLNKGTTMVYAYNKTKKERHVTLKGEAYFDVKHHLEESFKITADEVIIEDIGTTFNVKAYPSGSYVEVYVETGEVAFYTRDNPGLRLMPGETGLYNRDTKTFEKITAADTNVLSYKTKVFSFNNASLGAMVQDLNAVYDVKLRLANDSLENCRLNVSFKGEPIEVIAEIIAETLQLTLTQSGNEIVLDGDGCRD